MSYKSVIEPRVAAAAASSSGASVKPPLPQPPLKPKPNAWAKPPSDIKAKQVDGEKKKGNTTKPSTSGEPSSDKRGEISDKVESKEKGTSATATQRQLSSSSVDDDGLTSPPPLSTLLGPDNPNSANSSVTSSLEAPHSSANRFRSNHQSTHQGGHAATTNEDDVGYHLLNVCGQLSDEISTFMCRRALALDIRRKERSAVLGALGNTLGVSFYIRR